MRSLRYIVPVVLFLVVAGFLLVGLDRNPSEIPSPLIGKAAPAWSLPQLLPADRAAAAVGAPDGDAPLAAGTLKGAPYLLNIWASWCAPCLQEHPVLIELADRRLIALVGVNYKDRPEDARAWLARHGNPFGLIVADRDGRTAIDFGVYGVPETFLVDAQGVIRFKHIGPLTPEVLRSRLLPAIASLPVKAAAPQSSGPPIAPVTPIGPLTDSPAAPAFAATAAR